MGVLLAFCGAAALLTGAPGPRLDEAAEARERAVALLRSQVSDPDKLRHVFAVEATMRELAREAGGDPVHWGLAGLLHDIDLAETVAAGHPARHGVVGARLLAEQGYPPDVVHAIEAHDDAAGVERARPIDHALYCADQVYWAIRSSGLRFPSPEATRATPASVVEELGRRGNADRIDADLRRECALFGLTLDDVLRVSLGAMRAIAEGTPRAAARIDAGQLGAPISPLVYGQFIEHIGDIINDTLWAEMLDDRKFFHPVLAEEPKPAQRRFGPPPRRWTSVGPAPAVTMDATNPLAGDHSPLVTLDPAEPRGARQAGLALVEGKAYTGRVVLAGETDGPVQVSLVWGDGADDRQSVDVGPLTGEWTTFPLAFTAGSDSTDARLEISAAGSGSFRIGAVSLMPGDHVEGFRAEVVAALKSLRSGVYRFPGGNFVSAHEWRDAIGDPDRRTPVLDPVWNALQPNDVGTDEFMTLCRLLDVEPYITVNAGFGDAWSAAQLVEYANGSVDTPMGALRAANGHPEPYGVKYWGVGNEAWGGWQFGAMVLEQFVHKHNQFARAMRRVDPSIVLIGSGAMPDAMTGSRSALRLGDTLIPEPLGPADWTGGLFLHCLDNMDMISEHFYSYARTRFDLEAAEQVPLDPDEPLVDWMRRPANHVRAKIEAYQDYLERIPALREKRVPIALAEWAYAGVPPSSYKTVPSYAWVFHEMFRASGLYEMANFTFATSLLSTTRTDAVLAPAGLLFKLYRDHFGTIPVKVAGNAPPPGPKHPPGGEEPRVNAGSPTFPLDVVAAWTADRQALTLAVINPTESEEGLDVSFEGVELVGGGTLWRMAPSDLDATISVGEAPGVEVERVALDAAPASEIFAPHSVSVYVLPARE